MELNVEIFATGFWNEAYKINEQTLKGIAKAFNNLKEYHDVPLKIGHNDEQPLTDGEPAIGWVDKVWVEGNKLFAKFVDMPQIVFNAMQKKLYKHVSVELDTGVEHKGEDYEYVLSGVALLGADIPAVNTLKDLKAYMSSGELSFKKRVLFTALTETKENRGNNMDKDAEIKSLKVSLAATEADRDKAVTENVALKSDAIEKKALFAASEQREAARAELEKRGLLTKQLEAMVKEKKIAPFTRDDFLREYDEAKDIKLRDAVVFAVEKMEKAVDANPSYFGAEQARNIEERKRGEDGKNASEIVTERTREYMAKNGEKNFSVAKTAILRADSELANNYTKMEA